MAFPIVCASCTSNYGACFTECQARINRIDASEISTGNLCASGLLQSVAANLQNLQVLNLQVTNISGTVAIPSAALGSAAYSSSPAAVTLNGQQLQPAAVTRPGLVAKELASGSAILLQSDAVFVLDYQANAATFYTYYNAGAAAGTLTCSGTGVIETAAGATVTAFAVAPGARGIVFNAGAGVWVQFGA